LGGVVGGIFLELVLKGSGFLPFIEGGLAVGAFFGGEAFAFTFDPCVLGAADPATADSYMNGAVGFEEVPPGVIGFAGMLGLEGAGDTVEGAVPFDEWEWVMGSWGEVMGEEELTEGEVRGVERGGDHGQLCTGVVMGHLDDIVIGRLVVDGAIGEGVWD
jgi:hypothetical protein